MYMRGQLLHQQTHFRKNVLSGHHSRLLYAPKQTFKNQKHASFYTHFTNAGQKKQDQNIAERLKK